MKSLKSEKNKISIIGAGGHTRAVIGLINDQDFYIDGFYDDEIKLEEEILGVKGYEINNLPKNTTILLAIGENKKRLSFFNSYSERIYQPTIIHYSA